MNFTPLIVALGIVVLVRTALSALPALPSQVSATIQNLMGWIRCNDVHGLVALVIGVNLTLFGILSILIVLKIVRALWGRFAGGYSSDQ